MILLLVGGVILQRHDRAKGFLTVRIGVLGGVVGRESDVESTGLSFKARLSFELCLIIIRFYIIQLCHIKM